MKFLLVLSFATLALLAVLQLDLASASPFPKAEPAIPPYSQKSFEEAFYNQDTSGMGDVFEDLWYAYGMPSTIET